MSRAAPKIVPLRAAAAGADNWFRDVLTEEKIAIERFLAAADRAQVDAIVAEIARQERPIV